MDGIKTSERDSQHLNWADWMDELLKESFERKARAWTKARPSPARITDLEENPRAITAQIAAPV